MNYNKDFSNELTSKNLVTKKLVEKILIKYIKTEEYYIGDINDIYLIAYYLFHCKNLQNFIKLNQLQIRDIIYLISSARIVYGNDDRLIFREGELSLGFFLMFKGSIKAKISKFSLPDKLDSFFKREILQEYNLERDKDEATWLDIKQENKKEVHKLKEDIKYQFLSPSKISSHSPFSSIFQQRHEKRIKLAKRLSLISLNNNSDEDQRKLSVLMNEQVDLFTYDLNKDNILCFGTVNFGNEYMREEKQIHLTSAYFNNKKIDEDSKEINNIMLYIQEENLKDIETKISAINKERIRFLINTLTPLNQILSPYKKYFLKNIKLIYISVENQKEIIVKNNNFYLVYQGSCCDQKKKEIIYDKGSFIGLNNLFSNKDSNLDERITIFSKGVESILFQIDLNFLSQNNQIKIIKFLAEILTKQYFTRKIYVNTIMSYENKKMEEKEKELNNKIKDYLNKKNIKKIYFTDREIIDKQFKKKENTNLKCLNNIYINKKNIFKLLSKSEEQKRENLNESYKDKRIKYYSVNSANSRENSYSNSSSPRTCRSSSSTTSTFPFLNQSQKSLYNINQNPINNISFKKLCNAKTPKKIISRNNFNNINGFTNISSINSLSKYDKLLNKASSRKKSFINKNILLKNFSLYNNKKINKFCLFPGNSQ